MMNKETPQATVQSNQDQAGPQQPDMPPIPLVYRINARDEIVYVNQAWAEFASENTPEDLLQPLEPLDLAGRSLWDFVSDNTIRQLYTTMLRRVRSDDVVQFTFRCDSPDCRRYLQMDITACPDGGVEFRTTPLRIEPRAPQPLLDVTTPRNQELIRVCSWCNRIRVGDQWYEIEDVVRDSALFEREELPHLSHGICDDCYASMQSKLAT